MNFYQKILNKIVKNHIISLDDNILVVAGGEKDRNAFYSCGFKNVTITNLDAHQEIRDYKPYSWKMEDAEKLSFEDNEFDWVFVHDGLHHCASPHTALCEMLRVSKKGIGAFESKDSLLNWLANKLKLVPSYEIEPCILSEGKYGGIRNSQIPNHVYKWTEREVKKTVNSYTPQYQHKFTFYYGLTIPIHRLSMSKNIFKKIFAYIGKIVLPIFTFFFKSQGNLFAFIVKKNVKLQPWLKIENNEILFDLDYANNKFDPKKYSN